jgi:hypothetical protein
MLQHRFNFSNVFKHLKKAICQIWHIYGLTPLRPTGIFLASNESAFVALQADLHSMNFTFDPKKSAQAGAYLLQLNGGDMDKYKWIKMLYWSDRESLAKWNEPITGDNPVSMEHGQVLETIYDLTKRGCFQSRKEYWGKFISDADDEHRITKKGDPGVDELSRAEIKILEETYTKFKDFNFGKLKQFFAALPEHENVGASSKPLPVENILKAVGKNNEQIQEAEKEQHSLKIADMILG